MSLNFTVWFLLLSNLYVSSTKWQPTFDEFGVDAVSDVWVYVYLCVVCRLQTCLCPELLLHYKYNACSMHIKGRSGHVNLKSQAAP